MQKYIINIKLFKKQTLVAKASKVLTVVNFATGVKIVNTLDLSIPFGNQLVGFMSFDGTIGMIFYLINPFAANENFTRGKSTLNKTGISGCKSI